MKKGICIAALLLVALAAIAGCKRQTTAPAPTPTFVFTENRQTMMAAFSAPVWAEPEYGAERLGALTKGETVQVLGQCEQTGWYKIQLLTGPAYVSQDALVPEQSRVFALQAANNTEQIITVLVNDTGAELSMHVRENGLWRLALATPAKIGQNGLGKTKEGDRKTPAGQYGFTHAFGCAPDPGTVLPYLQVDSTYYWVDDSKSKYYNQLVTTQTVKKDWRSAERIANSTEAYTYVLAIDYNSACEPGVGSAIFLHCLPTSGAGCIAIDKTMMETVIKTVQPGCVLIIDYEENLMNY
ncbi:MAG: SH3 domain-containing protein [Clostridia bacterium]|nr:SH3 domain-containing protein [Clostridia bacterium]